MIISREQARDMEDAHLEGLHDESPREGCPECDGRLLRDYPTADQLLARLQDEQREADYIRDYPRQGGGEMEP